MADIKLVMNDKKSGKSHQKALSAEESKKFIGMKINDKFKGELIDCAGYEFQITGGSDIAGFPMRDDIFIPRKRILAVKGVGIKKKDKGVKQRKTVAGNMIDEKTAQINAVVLKDGAKSLAEMFPKTEKKE